MKYILNLDFYYLFLGLNLSNFHFNSLLRSQRSAYLAIMICISSLIYANIIMIIIAFY